MHNLQIHSNILIIICLQINDYGRNNTFLFGLNEPNLLFKSPICNFEIKCSPTRKISLNQETLVKMSVHVTR